MMSLGTNCVYYEAYRCAARMARQLGRPSLEGEDYNAAADALKAAINQRLWIVFIRALSDRSVFRLQNNLAHCCITLNAKGPLLLPVTVILAVRARPVVFGETESINEP